MEIINRRKIYVRVNDKLSNPRDVSNGSAQGLAISLPLSSIYTEGLEDYLRTDDDINVDISIRPDYQRIETDHSMFIDDLSVLIYTTNSQNGIKAAQYVVDKIYRYFSDNNLKLNTEKTQILCLRKKMIPFLKHTSKTQRAKTWHMFLMLPFWGSSGMSSIIMIDY